MTRTWLGRALAAALFLTSVPVAQAGGYYGGAAASISGGACTAGQAANGISSTGAPTGCFTPPIGQSVFFSPGLTGGSGATTYAYAPVSLTTGRLRISGIGNGSPGGSGGTGSSAWRNGGGGGGPGQKMTFDILMSDLATRAPGIQSLYVDFGTLGTPGAANSGTSSGGASGGNSSAITIKPIVNGSVQTTTIATILNGMFGQGGGVSGGPQYGAGGASGFTYLSNGGGSDANSGAAGGAASPNIIGPTGGGAGGGLSASNVETIGGSAGRTYDSPFSSTAASGSTGGGTGGTSSIGFNGSACLSGTGGGGGGSSASATVNGGNGGNATGYGAGGGGGGAGTNGAAAGAGGAGSWGCVEIVYLPY